MKGDVVVGLFDLSLSEIFARVIVLFLAITVHECAHGFIAYKLGDPTAKYAGRLSLNPISHLDPIGAICMVLCGFGWAKPVPINPMYFKDRKRDSALVALAGPVSNIILAFVSALLVAVIAKFGDVAVLDGGLYYGFQNKILDFLFVLLCQLAMLNIGFAIFNLIPFPPLDGSKILGAFLSYGSYSKLLMYETLGFPILILLSFLGVLEKILNIFIGPLWDMWLGFVGLLV